MSSSDLRDPENPQRFRLAEWQNAGTSVEAPAFWLGGTIESLIDHGLDLPWQGHATKTIDARQPIVVEC